MGLRSKPIQGPGRKLECGPQAGISLAYYRTDFYRSAFDVISLLSSTVNPPSLSERRFSQAKCEGNNKQDTIPTEYSAFWEETNSLPRSLITELCPDKSRLKLVRQGPETAFSLIWAESISRMSLLRQSRQYLTAYTTMPSMLFHPSMTSHESGKGEVCTTSHFWLRCFAWSWK